MRLPIYQVDAFADAVFGGNPAAVCPLEAWLPDAVMQAIAAENNLSETAFLVPEGDGYRLRWFTPKCEIDLCGHATLASASVVFAHLRPEAAQVAFETRSGRLTVARDCELLVMDFPARPPAPKPPHPGLVPALGAAPAEVLFAGYWLAVYESAATVRGLAPDFRALMAVDVPDVIVTAPGDEAGIDFVSRFFAPGHGIDEDPVTGAAHCILTPYWSARLGKRDLRAHQVSARGGRIDCGDRGTRVRLAGRAVAYLEGVITIP